jgi:hypothetical protein
MNDSERIRLIRLLGMTGSSFDGEALAALRMAQKLMAERHITWAELLNGSDKAAALRHELDVAKQAVVVLHNRNEELQRELTVARRTNGAAVDNHKQQARWALQFQISGRLQFDEYQRRFLADMLYRDAPLTEKQQGLLRRILRDVTHRTGELPP